MIINIDGLLIKVSITDGRRMISHHALRHFIFFLCGHLKKTSEMAGGTQGLEC